MLNALWFLSSDRIEAERGYVLCVTALMGAVLHSVHSAVCDSTSGCDATLFTVLCVGQC